MLGFGHGVWKMEEIGLTLEVLAWASEDCDHPGEGDRGTGGRSQFGAKDQKFIFKDRQ